MSYPTLVVTVHLSPKSGRIIENAVLMIFSLIPFPYLGAVSMSVTPASKAVITVDTPNHRSMQGFQVFSGPYSEDNKSRVGMPKVRSEEHTSELQSQSNLV